METMSVIVALADNAGISRWTARDTISLGEMRLMVRDIRGIVEAERDSRYAIQSLITFLSFFFSHSPTCH